MMEVAGSSERFRDDIQDCTVSTQKSRIQTVNRIQVHILVSVEVVVVVVFGRWVTVPEW